MDFQGKIISSISPRCITLPWCLEHWPWLSLHLMALLSKARKGLVRHGSGAGTDLVLMVIWDAVFLCWHDVNDWNDIQLSKDSWFMNASICTLPKLNMEPKNDGFHKATRNLLFQSAIWEGNLWIWQIIPPTWWFPHDFLPGRNPIFFFVVKENHQNVHPDFLNQTVISGSLGFKRLAILCFFSWGPSGEVIIIRS